MTDLRNLRASKVRGVVVPNLPLPASALPAISAWAPDNGCSLVAGQRDVLGGTTAVLMKEDSSNGTHTTYNYPISHADAGGDVMVRVLAKSMGRRWLEVTSPIFGSVWFDLQACAVGTKTTNGVQVPRASIASVGDGWCECRLATPSGGLTAYYNAYARLYLSNADNTYQYQGDGVSGVLLSDLTMAILQNSSWNL